MERSKAVATALVSVLLGGGALALAGFALASATPHQAAKVCQPTTPGNCTLTIDSYPDALAGEHGKGGGPHPDWVSYSDFNLVAPTNTTVTMTINQYDSGGALNNKAFFGRVWGTEGGTAQYMIPTDKGADTPVQTLSKVDPSNIGHTFTLRGIPGNASPLFVSVPLPASPSTNSVQVGDATYGSPVRVTFSFKVKGPGVYEWNCEFPCGGSREGQFGYAMSAYGYMSGTLTVK
jgi:hypothetical protein